MERTRTFAQGALFGLAAVGCVAAGPVGCAQWQQFAPGRSDRPAAVGEAATPGVDPYLAHHNKVGAKPEPGVGGGATTPDPAGQPSTPERTVIRSTAHPIPATPGTAESQDAPPSPGEIRLGAPISIRTAGPEVAESPSPARTGDPMEEARGLIARSKATLASMATYQVQIHRQERVGATLQPAEDLQLSIRRQPRAIRLEWPAGPHKGREVIYSTSDPSGMLHVHNGDSLIPIPRLSLPPDSPMVAKASRHPITEAGFELILANLEQSFSVQGDGAKVSYQGEETPESVGRPCHKFVRTTPGGETWLVYLDAATTLPALVRESGPSGDLLELDIFRDVRPNVAELASAEAFDPSKRWGAGGLGLFGRVARSPDGETKSADAPARR